MFIPPSFVRQQRGHTPPRWVLGQFGHRAYCVGSFGQLHVHCQQCGWPGEIHSATHCECATEMDTRAKGFECTVGHRCPAALPICRVSKADNYLEKGHRSNAWGVQGFPLWAECAALSQWHHLLQEDQQRVAGTFSVRGQEQHWLGCQ